MASAERATGIVRLKNSTSRENSTVIHSHNRKKKSDIFFFSWYREVIPLKSAKISRDLIGGVGRGTPLVLGLDTLQDDVPFQLSASVKVEKIRIGESGKKLILGEADGDLTSENTGWPRLS